MNLRDDGTPEGLAPSVAGWCLVLAGVVLLIAVAWALLKGGAR